MLTRIFVFCLLANVAAAQAKPLTLPDSIRVVTPAVVSIECVFDRLPKETQEVLDAVFYRWACGSGFIVDEAGYVVTALHVIKDFEKTTTIPVREGQLTIHRPLGPGRLVAGIAWHMDTEHIQARESTYDLQVSVVDRDEPHDIALLKMVRSPLLRRGNHAMIVGPKWSLKAPISGVASFDAERPREGEPVAVSGHPLGELAVTTNAGSIASSWSTTTYSPRESFDSYVMDMRVNSGDSGAPVFSWSRMAG